MTSGPEDVLQQLRGAVQPHQRALLTTLWDYHVTSGSWMPALEFHHLTRGPTAARQALEPLGGAVVWRSAIPDERYTLSVLGALLTERGPEFEALLVQWLFYLRQRYWEDPKFSQITVDDAREPMKLTGDQDAHLGRLIALASNFWGQSGGGNMPWQFAPPRNIDEIAEKTHEQLIEYLLAGP